MSLTAPPAPRPAEVRPGSSDHGGRRPNPRARTRRRLLLAGVLPSLLALGFAGQVLSTLDHNADGRSAWSDAGYGHARDEFAATGDRFDFFERWVSPFDEGTAAFGGGSYDDARDLFESALDQVPADQECLVRIDLALTHEALGDAAADDGEGKAAAESWQAGIDVLVAGGCSDDAGTDQRTQDSATTEERLREKLQQQEQRRQERREQRQQQKQQDKKDQQGGQGKKNDQKGDQKNDGEEDQPPQDPRERRLDRQNQEGQDRRDRNDDRQDYPGFGNDYEW